VSVRTVSKWLRRFRLEGKQGLLDRSSAPASVPLRTSEKRVAVIAALRRFTVTLNHVDHLRLWIENEDGEGTEMYEGLAADVAALPAFQRVKRRPADESAINRNFAIGWTSEPQLLLPKALGAAELLRYANAWAPVHSYYAVYLSLQAWFRRTESPVSQMITPRVLGRSRHRSATAVSSPSRGRFSRLAVPCGGSGLT
jgi:hypothetical protein